ncbi:1-acyl-sn-glycerol-3-phosphate acyltransferase [Acidipila sp. EB88]|uniref:lysophospholipid acyltransferase family protein n=1 Tax=Acidipila sp. EB88 TaxID=2305226 RepID=UPI000F5E14DE|nr:lysophospholipid acyltransferase family protein [Acidipila sp. EB88]RRA48198.1 1-acyl-sn-glycerol-3-phosphate acyltransferase [Acidipila sp. EB88]
MPRPLQPRPSPPPLSSRILSILVRTPLFLAGTAVCGSLSLLASCFEKDGRRQHRIAQAWARLSMFFAGASLSIDGERNLHKAPVAVYACNHLSYMDTPAIFSALPFQFRIVARHNLWKVPFIGWHLERSGQIPVNVGNPRASIASLSGGVKTLRAGLPLFIFPEGGRTHTGVPGDFLNGPAFMAIRAQVPIIPMALIGTHELLPMHSKTFYPVPVVLAVGEPISTEGRTAREVDALTAELARAIEALYFTHSWRERLVPVDPVASA